MRLLLPPSETKRSGGTGPALTIADLGFPELNPVRTLIASHLVALARDPAACRQALGLSPRQDTEIARNAELLDSPTMPAIERYTGVLYDAIGLPELPAAARRRASRHVVVCSALFGAVRASEPIPAYRLSAGNVLPNVGSLSALWRPSLAGALASHELVIDLRSGAYVNLAPIDGSISVRVVGANGRSVSHNNKAAKGRLVRAFLTAPRVPTTLAALMRAASANDLVVRHPDPHRLEIVA